MAMKWRSDHRRPSMPKSDDFHVRVFCPIGCYLNRCAVKHGLGFQGRVLKAAFQNRVRACCLGLVTMLALPGASGVLAATGDEPASHGFWAAMDSVGKLYAIKGRQIADDVKTNYLQLAGGDPDDLEVPSAIIEDGFMDGGGEQPGRSNGESVHSHRFVATFGNR